MTNEYDKNGATIVNKFRLLRETFTDLNNEIAQLHGDMPLHEKGALPIFTALSRMLAFSDQIHLTLSLMGEDINVLERTTVDPVNSMWNEQIEDCLDNWFGRARMGNDKVH